MPVITAVQVNASDNMDDNLNSISQIVMPLAEQGIKMFVLSECAALCYCEDLQ